MLCFLRVTLFLKCWLYFQNFILFHNDFFTFSFILTEQSNRKRSPVCLRFCVRTVCATLQHACCCVVLFHCVLSANWFCLSFVFVSPWDVSFCRCRCNTDTLRQPMPARCVTNICLLCTCAYVPDYCNSHRLYVWLCILCCCESKRPLLVPASPGCDLGFHLLSLGLSQPTALSSQPAAQQLSPHTRAHAHAHGHTPQCFHTVSHTGKDKYRHHL